MTVTTCSGIRASTADWSPMVWPGRRAWSRRIAVDAVRGHSVTLAVWDDGFSQWEWEVLDTHTDRHLAGGMAPTARAALDSVLALLEGTDRPAWPSPPMGTS
jgi:hypothetical protein